jgi:hypothetical protein
MNYFLRSSLPRGYNKGDFSFIVEDEFRINLQDAWESFCRPVLRQALNSSEYTCGQTLQEFMKGLGHPEIHSGGSSVTYFQVCKLAQDDWSEFLRWCVSDQNLYLNFRKDTRENARTALSKLTFQS